MSACPYLNKLDGMKVTSMDRELGEEYQRLMDEELGLIPRKRKGKGRLESGGSKSPSTVVSMGEGM